MQEELNVAKARAILLPMKRSSLKQSVVASTFCLLQDERVLLTSR